MITPRVLLSVLVAAVVSLAAAAWSYSGNHPWADLDGTGEPLFPDLDQRLDQVAAIEVRDQAGGIALRRDGDTWRIVDEDGYPADVKRVHALLVGLADLRRLEPKTDRPERYATLGVDAPDSPGGSGRLVTLQAADGADLAAVILGSLRAQRLGEKGTGFSGTYVRLPDQAQSWLVSGDLDVSSDLDRWVSTNVLGLRRDQIAEVVIMPVGQSPLTLKRAPGSAGEQTFTIAPLPADRSPKSSSGPMLAATDFAGLSFDAVRKVALEGGNSASTVDLVTTDGMKLRLVLNKGGEENWLAVTQVAPGENEDVAKALTGRTKGWQFRLSDAAAKPFFASLTELTEQRPAPGSDPATTPQNTPGAPPADGTEDQP